MTPVEQLQALATLDRRLHVMRMLDSTAIELWLSAAGEHMDIDNFSEKTLENIAVLYHKYFQ